MLESFRPLVHVATAYQPVFRQIGFTPEAVFTDPAIIPWRKLNDRENCTWDLDLPDGRSVRLHVKRFPPLRGIETAADDESRGYRAMETEGIPTAKLVAWGRLANRRSFIITEDLAGYAPADKLIESGVPFEKLLLPLANLTAKLHGAQLHHRDLYLCHYFARVDAQGVDLRLIDAARVRRIPGMFSRRRWIVKDLAQFWYSTLALPISEQQRSRWLDRYSQECGIVSAHSIRSAIERKARSIGAHDARLRKAQPGRNISIPTQPGPNT